MTEPLVASCTTSCHSRNRYVSGLAASFPQNRPNLWANCNEAIEPTARGRCTRRVGRAGFDSSLKLRNVPLDPGTCNPAMSCAIKDVEFREADWAVSVSYEKPDVPSGHSGSRSFASWISRSRINRL